MTTPARQLLDVARLASRQGDRRRVVQMCREALKQGTGDPVVQLGCRHLLSRQIAKYHLPLMNDVGRVQTWRRAIETRVTASTRVLEIGTAAGLLAMLAARAGARGVIALERDPVLADLARIVIDRNGLSDRIDVVAESSRAFELTAGAAPPDLVICDLVSADLVQFHPLDVAHDVRTRLAPNADFLPNAATVRVAAAHWDEYGIFGKVPAAGGFDLSDLDDFRATTYRLSPRATGVTRLSMDHDAVSAVLGEPSPGAIEFDLSIQEAGVVNAIAQSVRLRFDRQGTLVHDTVVRMHPLRTPISVARGDVLQVSIVLADSLLVDARLQH